jgi:hypothetical protein
MKIDLLSHTKIDSFSHKLSHSDNISISIMSTCEDINRKLTEVNRDLDIVKGQLAESHRKLDDTICEYDRKLGDTIREYDRKLDDKDRQILRLYVEIDSMTKHQSTTVSNYDNIIGDLKKQIAKLEAKITELEAQNRILTDELSDIRKQNQILTDGVSEIRKQNQKLTEQNQKLTYMLSFNQHNQMYCLMFDCFENFNLSKDIRNDPSLTNDQQQAIIDHFDKKVRARRNGFSHSFLRITQKKPALYQYEISKTIQSFQSMPNTFKKRFDQYFPGLTDLIIRLTKQVIERKFPPNTVVIDDETSIDEDDKADIDDKYRDLINPEI